VTLRATFEWIVLDDGEATGQLCVATAQGKNAADWDLGAGGKWHISLDLRPAELLFLRDLVEEELGPMRWVAVLIAGKVKQGRPTPADIVVRVTATLHGNSKASLAKRTSLAVTVYRAGKRGPADVLERAVLRPHATSGGSQSSGQPSAKIMRDKEVQDFANGDFGAWP
jgi:hypothetical protein